jgi:hypothetical protein
MARPALRRCLQHTRLTAVTQDGKRRRESGMAIPGLHAGDEMQQQGLRCTAQQAHTSKH